MSSTNDRLNDSIRKSEHGCVGNDLTEEDLDDLWAMFSGRPKEMNPASAIPERWENEQSKLAYRMICRLTRAELKVALLTRHKDSLEAKLEAKLETLGNASEGSVRVLINYTYAFHKWWDHARSAAPSSHIHSLNDDFDKNEIFTLSSEAYQKLTNFQDS